MQPPDMTCVNLVQYFRKWQHLTHPSVAGQKGTVFHWTDEWHTLCAELAVKIFLGG